MEKHLLHHIRINMGATTHRTGVLELRIVLHQIKAEIRHHQQPHHLRHIRLLGLVIHPLLVLHQPAQPHLAHAHPHGRLQRLRYVPRCHSPLLRPSGCT